MRLIDVLQSRLASNPPPPTFHLGRGGGGGGGAQPRDAVAAGPVHGGARARPVAVCVPSECAGDRFCS